MWAPDYNYQSRKIPENKSQSGQVNFLIFQEIFRMVSRNFLDVFGIFPNIFRKFPRCFDKVKGYSISDIICSYVSSEIGHVW
jgi:hypothetical protein